MKTQKKTRKKLTRKFWVSAVAILLAVLMAGSVLFGALSTMVSAASSSALKAELEALQEQADDIADQSYALELQISQNLSETDSIVQQKMEIDQQMELTRQQIENLDAQIQQYNLLIAAKQEELDQAELEAEDMASLYKERIRAMEESGDVSYWSILFQASSIMDLLSRLDDIEDVALADQAMMEQMQEAAEAIAEAKADIEVSRSEMEDARTAQSQLEVQLEQQRAQADLFIAALLEQKDLLDATAEEYDILESQVRSDILDTQTAYENALADEEAARKIEEARQNAAAGNLPSSSSSSTSSSSSSSSSSGFQSPLSGTYVTCPYGYREHPIYGYYAMHYGVDLAGSSGQPIYAIQSGTVTVATYSDVNGYYVTLNHNDGFASLYAHMTNYIVSVGDTVTKGQVIGYVGSTGWSTGPHLHFEVFYGGVNVNPADYVSF